MTKANELNLTNLIDNVRKIENAANAKNKYDEEEIEKIRKYCIDALRDYNETCEKIVELINVNRDLWEKPKIFSCGDNLVRGKFFIGDYICVYVGNISVKKIKYGLTKEDIDGKDWIAESIEIQNYDDNSSPYKKDLISATFNVVDDDGRIKNNHYTEEVLTRYHWTTNGWPSMKGIADRTRKRTEFLINAFKNVLENRISESTEKLNLIESCAYTKVQF